MTTNLEYHLACAVMDLVSLHWDACQRLHVPMSDEARDAIGLVEGHGFDEVRGRWVTERKTGVGGGSVAVVGIGVGVMEE